MSREARQQLQELSNFLNYDGSEREEPVSYTHLDVYKRQSLGYRKAEDNPWEILKEKYPVGSVVKAKIVGMTTFGAFAQILPGVDGLIHISQIADHRVEKPQDELKMGEEVTVKITNIDFDKKRISLSIRELLEEAADSAEETPETSEEE